MIWLLSSPLTVGSDQCLCVGIATFVVRVSSCIEVPSSPVLVEGSPAASAGDALPTALDVGEVHRIFKLRDINAAGFIHGLSTAACHGRVSWISFLRYMYGFANAKPLTEESCSAVMMARKIFDVYDEDKQREVDLRTLASGLAVREGIVFFLWHTDEWLMMIYVC